jgi:hypothetical protein
MLRPFQIPQNISTSFQDMGCACKDFRWKSLYIRL